MAQAAIVEKVCQDLLPKERPIPTVQTRKAQEKLPKALVKLEKPVTEIRTDLGRFVALIKLGLTELPKKQKWPDLGEKYKGRPQPC